MVKVTLIMCWSAWATKLEFSLKISIDRFAHRFILVLLPFSIVVNFCSFPWKFIGNVVVLDKKGMHTIVNSLNATKKSYSSCSLLFVVRTIITIHKIKDSIVQMMMLHLHRNTHTHRHTQCIHLDLAHNLLQ